MEKDLSYLYPFPFIFAALCIFVASQYTLVRHNSRGEWYLFFTCLAAAFWSTSEGLLYLDLNQGTKILLTKCQYFVIAPILPLTLLCVLTVFGIRLKMIGLLRSGLFVLITLVIVLVWTNPLHKLIFTGYYTIDTGAVEMLGLRHGPLWWFLVAYHYSFVVVISVILLKTAYTASGFERSQALVILAAIASVWISNAIYVAGLSPVKNMDISPIAFSIVAGSMAWGFFRHNLLDTIHVAQTEVFRGMDDAILVFDERNRIVDFNPSAEAIFKADVLTDNDKQTQKVFEKFPVLLRLIEGMRHSEVPIQVDGQRNIYDVRVSKLFGRSGKIIGRIMALQDITIRKLAIDAILESEEKYKFLAEYSTDVIYKINIETEQYTYVSPSVESIYGYTPKEMLGLKARDTVTPESYLLQREKLETAILQGKKEPELLEMEVLHKDGHVIPVEVHARYLYNNQGMPTEILGVARDISARKHAC
ncbi:MAG: PAS domain S-box protein [Desulfobacterales bacterium]|nr:PAS domain S-box protein [Desulfobacterales bacterium]